MKNYVWLLLIVSGLALFVPACDSDSEGDADDDDDNGEDTSSANEDDSSEGDTDTGVGAVFPDDVTSPRIMIVGDSIAAGPGCFKKFLVQNLEDNGYSQFEFVGEYEDDCSGGNVRHSAVSCATTVDFTNETFTIPSCFGDDEFPGMSPLVATHEPDLILLQLGVNDVWSGSVFIPGILDNYERLIEQAREQNPRIAIVVAQIHKIITDNCTNEASTEAAEELVNAVPGFAEEMDTPDSRVLVADLWTNSDPEEDSNGDCVHPNNTTGSERMAENWYTAIKDILPK